MQNERLQTHFFPPPIVAIINLWGFSPPNKLRGARVFQSVAAARGERGCSGIRGPTSEGACCTFPQRLEGPHDHRASERSRSGIKTQGIRRRIKRNKRGRAKSARPACDHRRNDPTPLFLTKILCACVLFIFIFMFLTIMLNHGGTKSQQINVPPRILLIFLIII